MRITNDGLVMEGVFGAQPELFYGTAAPDGDANPWLAKAVGSEYTRTTAGFVAKYVKLQNNGADTDWVLLRGCVIDTFSFSDMVDSGTTGTFTMTGDIPIGAVVESCDIRGLVKFDGDTSAVVTVGEPAGGDVDRYMTGTPNVFQALAYLSLGAVGGTAGHVAAISPTVVVTTAADFTSVTAGSMTVAIWFHGVV